MVQKEKIDYLKSQKEFLLKIKIDALEKQNNNLIYENNQLKSDLDYAKRNGGIKRLVLTKPNY